MLLLDDDDELPDVPSPSEMELADRLGPDGLRAVDRALLDAATPRFLKIARVVSQALQSQGLFSADDAPADLFTRRIIGLIGAGLLESAGNPRKPRFSEVRLQDDNDEAV